MALNIDDSVRFRAYLIWEDRQALGESGTRESDWLEAERQLHIPNEEVMLLAKRLLKARGLSPFPCIVGSVVWEEARYSIFEDSYYVRRSLEKVAA